MGKISSKEASALVKEGILSDKAIEAMEKRKMVSKKRSSVKRYMKTEDGVLVEPNLYFRGAKGTKPSKQMNEFVSKYNELIEKYTTTNTK